MFAIKITTEAEELRCKSRDWKSFLTEGSLFDPFIKSFNVVINKH